MKDNKRIEAEKYLNEKYGYMENRDIRLHKTADSWVDLSYTQNNGNRIDWKMSIGNKIPFKYKDISGEFVIHEYITKVQVLTLSYNNVLLKHIGLASLLRCQLGGILGKVNLNKTTEEFKKEMEEINNNVIIVGEYIGADAKIGCACKVCKHHWDTTPSILSRGHGCPACAGKEVCNYNHENCLYYQKPFVVRNVLNIEDCFRFLPFSNFEIDFICRECGNVEPKKIQNVSINGFSCSRCGDGVSYPEKFCYNLMNQIIGKYNISEIKREFSDSWTNKRRYDVMFTFNNNKYILEMDGAFHKNDNKMSGQTAIESQAIDEEKDLMAANQGITIIRIDCDYGCVSNRHEYIKNNILNSVLSDLFNGLSFVDWNEIEMQSVSSLQFQAWNLRRESNNKLSVKEISSILNISKNAVLNYLKNGNSLGVCEYNPKEEFVRLKSAGTIFVEIDGVLYNKSFSSIDELRRKSIDEFGFNFDEKNIRSKMKDFGYFQRSKTYRYKYVFIKTPHGTTFEELQEQLNKQQSA